MNSLIKHTATINISDFDKIKAIIIISNKSGVADITVPTSYTDGGGTVQQQDYFTTTSYNKTSLSKIMILLNAH